MLATLAVLLAGCTGDAEPAGEEAGAPQSPVEAIRALPDAGEVEAAVSESAEETTVPEDVVPPLPLIGNHGVLSPLEQRCVRDYGASQIPDLCTLGAPGAERRIVLWGDTRAAMWMPALTRIAEQTGYHLVTITQMQCPPLVGLTPWLAPEQRPYDECEATNANTVEAINTVIQPDLVVLAGAVRNTAVVRDGRPVPLGTGRPDNTWTPGRAAAPIWQDRLERTITSSQDAQDFVLGEAT